MDGARRTLWRGTIAGTQQGSMLLADPAVEPRCQRDVGEPGRDRGFEQRRRQGVEEHEHVPPALHQAPERGLQPAQDVRDAGESLAQLPGVDHRGLAGTGLRRPSRGATVGAALFPLHSIPGKAGVEAAGGHPKKEARGPELPEVVQAPPIRLRQNPHPKTPTLQPAADQSRPEKMVIHVGVPGHEDDVEFVPPTGTRFGQGGGQK